MQSTSSTGPVSATGRVARWSASHKWLVLIATILVLVGTVFASASVTPILQDGGEGVGESQAAADLFDQKFPPSAERSAKPRCGQLRQRCLGTRRVRTADILHKRQLRDPCAGPGRLSNVCMLSRSSFASLNSLLAERRRSSDLAPNWTRLERDLYQHRQVRHEQGERDPCRRHPFRDDPSD